MAGAVFSRLKRLFGALAVLCFFCGHSGLAQSEEALLHSPRRRSQTGDAGTVVWVSLNAGGAKITESQQDGEQLLVSMIFTHFEFEAHAVPRHLSLNPHGDLSASFIEAGHFCGPHSENIHVIHVGVAACALRNHL